MSKRASLARYNLIIKKLRRYPTDFKNIADYLEEESRIQGYNFRVSKRTFQRDLNDIRSLYNIDIQYDFSKRVYFIKFEDREGFGERILQSFDVFNALRISERLSKYIHFERRNPEGTEYLSDFLKAIKTRSQVKIAHQKFEESKAILRHINPLALQEFKNRWYVVAQDIDLKKKRTFALDRILDVTLMPTKFTYPKNFTVESYFKDYFGVVREQSGEPVEIELSFNPHQGEYIKSLPLHSSQEILVDNNQEVRIRLKVVITFDFIIELLSLGKRVRVVKPQILIEYLKDEYQEALDRYS